MQRSARVSAVLVPILISSLAAVSAASAQPAAGALNAKELSGMQLFNQHCRVCHTKPLLTAGQYGPVLSKSSLGGDAQALHDFIANGAPKMPGFKYSFASEQIDAIVAYIKTVPTPEAPAAAPGSGKAQDNSQAD